MINITKNLRRIKNGFGNRVGQDIYSSAKLDSVPKAAPQKPQDPEQQIHYILDLTRQYHNLLMSEDGVEKREQTFYWDANVAAMEEGRKDSYYLQDDLGSPMQLMDGDGEVREAYGFDEFGISLNDPSESQLQPFGFTGYQMEAAGGLYFAQARRYDAGVGRFVSEDKIPSFTVMPLTLNRYSYCWNRPVDYVDLDGKIPAIGVVAIIAIMALCSCTLTGCGRKRPDDYRTEISPDINCYAYAFQMDGFKI